jgi:hypothetical protein
VLANGKKNGCPLCSYDIKESSVGVTLSDQPVGPGASYRDRVVAQSILDDLLNALGGGP